MDLNNIQQYMGEANEIKSKFITRVATYLSTVNYFINIFNLLREEEFRRKTEPKMIANFHSKFS